MVKASVGQELTLNCHIDAFPPAHSEWIRNGDEIVDAINSDRYRVFKEDKDLYKVLFKLVIHNVKPSDFGVYTCFANNSVGSKEDSLNVIGKLLP